MNGFDIKDLFFIILSILLGTIILHTIPLGFSEKADDNNQSIRNSTEENRESIYQSLLTLNSESENNQNNSNIDMYRSPMFSNPPFIFSDKKSGIQSVGIHSFWQDLFMSCNTSFKCTTNNTTGWKSKNSFQLTTFNNTNNTWSSIQSTPMNVNPGDKFQLVNHMKLNPWATQSHVVLEGYNETSKQWYRIAHCPSGVNGPMEWREFTCTITIPENTTKIREVLKAGWSSKPNREATTWFDSFYVLDNEASEIVDKDLGAGILKIDFPSLGSTSFYSNPRFYLFDNQSHVITFGLDSFWNDTSDFCSSDFKCTANDTTGWKSNSSFQLTTSNNTNNTWSSIHSQQIYVKPSERYELLTHMKLNQWAVQSHIVLEGYNETSRQWYRISHCPSGVNGPMEWREFSCTITIPENTTKIREVLNAGWSSQPNKKATTWFDSFIVTRLSIVTDPKLKAEVVSSNLSFPTGISFIGQNDMLVLEKDKGTVQRIVNDVKSTKPVLDLAVRQNDGLLAIATNKNTTTGKSGIVQSTYVYLYFTAAEKGDRDINEGPASNRLYRFELVNNRLVNPKLLLELPAAFTHNGGRIVIGPDKYVYLSVGELRNRSVSEIKNLALNYAGKGTNESDGRGGILRLDQNGAPVSPILGNTVPLNKYYAYGIRNSFGMDFDPLTGKLWDTENGPEWGDEINLVDPGFNSGNNKVQGVWNVLKDDKKGSLAPEKPDNLVDFGGKGKYSSPEFTWNRTVGPTDLKFLSTDKLGKQYENDMLVADVNNHRIYDFKLNQERTGLLLQGPLTDKVADNNKELADLIFAEGFDDIITDLEVGPDGYLYVVAGKIFRIVPGDQKDEFLPYVNYISKNGFALD